jgi:hypothetical protein
MLTDGGARHCSDGARRAAFRSPKPKVVRRKFHAMETFACLLCDWRGRTEPVLVPTGGGGGIEFLPLQRGGFKPLLYALEVVMDGTDLVRLGNFDTMHRAAGWAIWFHNKLLNEEDFHCRVRPVRDFFAGDEIDPSLFVGSEDYFVPAR